VLEVDDIICTLLNTGSYNKIDILLARYYDRINEIIRDIKEKNIFLMLLIFTVRGLLFVNRYAAQSAKWHRKIRDQTNRQHKNLFRETFAYEGNIER